MEAVFSPSNVSDIVLWALVLTCSLLGMVAMAAPNYVMSLKNMIMDNDPYADYDDYRDLNDEQVIRIRKVKHVLDDLESVWESFPDGTVYVTASGDIFFYPDNSITPSEISNKIIDINLNDIVEFLVFELSDGKVLLPTWMD